jgi:hypothetical protein
LAAWSADRVISDKLFNCGNPGGLYEMPFEQDIRRLEFAPPVAALCRHVLASAGDPSDQGREVQPKVDQDGTLTLQRRLGTLHSQCREAWSERHEVLQHDTIPPLKAPYTDLDRSVCRHVGMCLCENEPLKLFRESLTKVLSKLCIKKSGNQYKAPTSTATPNRIASPPQQRQGSCE